PQAKEHLHERVDITDREDVLSLLELELIAADDRLHDAARAAEELPLDVLELLVLLLGYHLEHRRDLRRHPLRRLDPDHLEGAQENADDEQRPACVAQQLANEDESHR